MVENPKFEKLDDDDFTPIKLLSQSSTSYVLKARLESIGKIVTFNKKTGGQGRVTNCIFIDNSSKIAMTFWSEDIDKFVSKFEENKIYIISNADVKKCGAYNKTEHSCELHCNKSTQITLGQETSNIKQFNINMEALSSINTEKTEATKTVYCVIFSLPQLSEITKKDGTSLKKISFNIIDQSQ